MPEPAITPEQIAACESLLGLHFQPAQRQQMSAKLEQARSYFDALRAAPIANSLPMALHFDPRASDSQPAPVPRHYAMSPQPALPRPPNLEQLAFAPLTQLAPLLRRGKVRSRELTEMYLRRLKRYGPPLHCVVTLMEESALAQADRADSEIQRGIYRGPLHGIPWGAKDLLATRAAPTSWGAQPFAGQHIDSDATVVQRLDAAGAVLLAKLTLGALANGDVWYGGKTRNPWNPSEGSSGSSAGSAAATAAGLVAFSIGSETMGSIVSPSTRCGVTGLRPSFGRVSRHGAMALSWSLDKIGPICRSVEDCALVFSAIYGPDGNDLSLAAMPFHWDPAFDPRQLRLGYLASAFEPPPHQTDSEQSARQAAHQANNAAALDVMRAQGFNLQAIELPSAPYDALFIILVAEAAAAFDEITRKGAVDSMARQDEDAWPNVFRAARLIPAVEYINANRLRSQLLRDTARLMRDIDVFIAPSHRGFALHLGNLAGLPCVVLPNGFTPQHMPTSICFVGAAFKEAQTLAVAKAYQNATDWHRQVPPLP